MNGKDDTLDPPMMWEYIHPSIDTLIVPPSELNSREILAVIRCFDFDSDMRLMSSGYLSFRPQEQPLRKQESGC
jgi:hypothetical protein